MRRTVLIDAPSNLGLRPPAPGCVPGCYKLAGALREQGLLRRLGALEGGVVVPPRYDLGEWREGEDGDFNAAALAGYTRKLAGRVERHVRDGDFPVVLGGDCSILLGAVLGLRRLGRYGVAYVDGHGDFRHPGNVAVSGPLGAAAGEGVAQITGRGQADLTDLDGLRPYVRDADVCVLGIRDADVCVLGIRDADEDQEEMAGLGIRHTPVGAIRRRGPDAVARDTLKHLQSPPLDGFWIHLDAARTATRRGTVPPCSPASLRTSLRNPDRTWPRTALFRPAGTGFHGQQEAAAAGVARSSIARQPWPRVCDAPP
ncbi:arginase family protein [Streptomyces lydicus]|uniref:arginase family protein n=1 Tax=Streptomyces lydicus TaxID=47763 RepID=UPI00379536FF